MTQKENTRLYTADEGKLIVRVADGFIMGDALDLGVGDSIDNYEEREFTQAEYDAFWASIGAEPQTRNEGEEVQA